jgi:integrase
VIPASRQHDSGSRRDRGARYAFFYRGRWRVNPWVTHPPFCACARCARRRTSDQWDRPVRVRIDRVSPYNTEAASIAYAAEVRRREEARLLEATQRAVAEQRAVARRVTFSAVCEAYRDYQLREGKRLDRDQSRIDRLEDFFGAERDAAAISKADVERLRRWLLTERQATLSTVERYLATLIAAMNGAVKDGLLEQHSLHGLRRSRLPRLGRPATFTSAQVAVLLGQAMDVFEAEQDELRRLGQPHSLVPLRGLCLIAYRTLLRPSNNFTLRWEDLRIEPSQASGSFKISKHKNASKGLVLEGPLAPTLVSYLLTIRPDAIASGLVHPNPVTARPFTNIRRAWRRLLSIANTILSGDGQIPLDTRFYIWRATGATELAASGADPVLITKLMGDSSLRTVMKHYFDSSMNHMAAAVARWDSAGRSAGDLC